MMAVIPRTRETVSGNRFMSSCWVSTFEAAKPATRIYAPDLAHARVLPDRVGERFESREAAGGQCRLPLRELYHDTHRLDHPAGAHLAQRLETPARLGLRREPVGGRKTEADLAEGKSEQRDRRPSYRDRAPRPMAQPARPALPARRH